MGGIALICCIGIILPLGTLGQFGYPKQNTGRDSGPYVDEQLQAAIRNSKACNCPKAEYTGSDVYFCSDSMRGGGCERNGEGSLYKCSGQGATPVKENDCSDCKMAPPGEGDGGFKLQLSCGENKYDSAFSRDMGGF